MKKIIFLSLGCMALFASCRKDYTCVCTDTLTGQQKVVDEYHVYKIDRKIVEKSCENDNDVSGNKDCHVES